MVKLLPPAISLNSELVNHLGELNLIPANIQPKRAISGTLSSIPWMTNDYTG